jgi:hypothetical protein
VIGRWWRDETAEIDVLGLSGDRPVLVGEARWQAKPLTERDLADLRRKAHHLPPADGVRFVFWARGGATSAVSDHPEVRTFTPADIVGG